MSAYRYCEFCEERFPTVTSHSAATCAARQRRARLLTETANAALRQENAAQAKEIIRLRARLQRYVTVYE